MRPGHVSVIIGASQGIGRALGRALARRGGSVVAVARNRDRLATTLAELLVSGGGDHLVFALDVSVAEDMRRLAAACAEHYGGVDLLVVSAATAGYDGEGGHLPPATRDLPLAAWQRAIDVNLHGAFLANRAFLPLMTAREEGDIVNISSSLTPHGLHGTPLAPAYAATKFALAAYSQALAEEAAEYGVRVIALFPGAVETPLIAGTMLARPYGGSITADNFAEAVVNLLVAGSGADTREPFILPLPVTRPVAGAAKEVS